MRYAMTFDFDVYDFDGEREEHVISRPGDYIKMKRWTGKGLPKDADEAVTDLLTNYAALWFVWKREGALEAHGLAVVDEPTVAVLEDMAERFSVYVNGIKEDALPLSERPSAK